ncbi:beta strand repeat-containing protein [Spirochaeta dissipatitropha]
MKSRNRVAMFGLAALLVVISATGCKNLFEVGLGSAVDLEPPRLVLETPGIDSYLRGQVEFSGQATDDQAVARVEYQIRAQDDTSFSEWTQVDEFSDNEWKINIDTRGLADGRLRLNVRATDTAGKQALLSDLTFSVDNTPPVVLLTSPRDFFRDPSRGEGYNTFVAIDVAVADVHPLEYIGVQILDSDGNSLVRDDHTQLAGNSSFEVISLNGKKALIQKGVASPWTFIFNSRDFYRSSGDDSEDFNFHFFARDEAGNRSTSYYHIDDIRKLSNESDRTIQTVTQLASRLKSGGLTNLKSRSAAADPMVLHFNEKLDIPWVQIVTFDIGRTEIGNESVDDPYRIAAGNNLIGSAQDDDGIAIGFPLIFIQDKNDDRLPEPSASSTIDDLENEGWIQLAEPDDRTPAQRQFSWPIPAEIEERRISGNQRVYFLVRDTGGAQRMQVYYSLIFTGAPLLEISSPGQSEVVRNTFTISGTASHEDGAPSVFLHRQTSSGSVLLGEIEEGSQWSFEVDTNELNDGSHTFIVSARMSEDEGQAQATLAVRVDNTPPVVSSIPGMANNQVIHNSSYSFTVPAADPGSGIARFEYRLRTSSIGEWTEFQTADTGNFGEIELSNLENGLNQQLEVRVTDNAGNSTVISRNFNVSLSLPGLIYEHKLEDGSESWSSDWSGTVYKSNATGFSLRGTADSAVGIDRIEVQAVGDSSGTVGTIELVETGLPGDLSRDWTVQVEPTEENLYTIEVTAYDMAGRSRSLSHVLTWDASPPIIEVLNLEDGDAIESETFEIRGTALDFSGVQSVEYRIDSGSGFSDWALVSGTQSWRYTVEGLEEGPGLQIQFRATDRAGNSAVTNSITFGLDKANPDLVIDLINGGAAASWIAGTAVNDNVVLSGHASDASGIQSLSISLDGGSSFELMSDSPEEGESVDITPVQWEHTIVVPSDGSMDGLRNIIVRAVDAYGKVTDRSISMRFDATPPVVTVSNLVDDALISSTPFTLNGTWTDMGGSGTSGGLAGIDFRINDDDEWQPVDKEAGDSLSASSWSINLTADRGLQQGLNQSISLRARDVIGNQSTALEINGLKVDTAPPVLVENNYDSGLVYSNSLISFSGTATDFNGIASVTVDGMPVTSTNDFATWTFTDNDPQEGTNTYSIVATDNAGRSTTISRSIVYDTIDPDVEITNLRPTIELAGGETRVNNIVEFSVAASDENGLGSGAVRWYMLRSDSDDPEFTDAFPEGNETGGTFAATPYSAKIDTRDLDDNTEYTLWILVRDRAGNETRVSRVVIVDQDSDIPTVSFTDLDAGVDSEAAAGLDGQNLLDFNARIRGTVSDDDRVAAASIELSINGGAWVSPTSVGANSRNVSFTHNLDALDEGIHSFSIRFSDLASEKIQKDGALDVAAVTQEIGPIWFAIDFAPPTIEINNPGSGAARNSDFTISGIAVDANGLGLHVDGSNDPVAGSWVQVNTGSGWENAIISGNPQTEEVTWEYTVLVGADGLADGNRTIQVRTVDRFGKTASAQRSVLIDTALPVIDEISIPDEALEGDPSTWLTGSAATASGTAVDTGSPASGVAQVKYRIYSGSYNSGDDAEWASALGGFDGTSFAWNTSLNLGAIGEGIRTLEVRAVDAAGNIGDVSYVEFGVDQNNPGITETGIAAPVSASGNVFELSGSVSDSNELSSIVVTQQRGEGEEIVIYDNSGLAGTSADWTLGSLPRDPAAADPVDPSSVFANTAGVLTDGDGIYIYRATVTDIAGKTAQITRTVTVDLVGPEVSITAPPASGYRSGDSTTISGTVADVEFVSDISEVRFWIGFEGTEPPASYEDWIATAATKTGNGQAEWSQAVTLGGGIGQIPEGRQTLHVVARDTAGNWSEDVAVRTFIVDQADPTVEENVIGSSATQYSNTSFSLGGTASDSNELDRVEIRQGGAEGTLVATIELNGDNDSWNIGDLPRDTGAADPTDPANVLVEDGTFQYHIRVIDIAGRSSSLTRTVQVDVTPPNVEIGGLTPIVEIDNDDFVNGIISFTATNVSDNTGGSGLISNPVRWWILPSADPAPVWDTAGFTSFGAAPYSATVDTNDAVDGYDDGDYVLYFASRDQAGNTAIASRAFIVDQESDRPIFTFTTPDSNGLTVYTDRNNMNATGTVQDVDGLALLQRRFPGEAEWTTVQQWTDNWPTSYSWSINIDAIQDGANRTFELRAEDRKGETIYFENEVSSPTFTISTGSPEVEISAPATGDFYNGDSDIAASGTATIDTSLVDAEITLIEYRLGTSGTWTEITSGNLGDVVSWSENIPIPVDQNEGVLRLSIRATADNGQTGTAVREIRIDKTAPTISFTTPSNAAIVNGNLTVSGIAGDDNSVDRVQLELIRQSDSVVVASYADTGSFNWSRSINTVNDLDDLSNYILRATVFDAAGNSAVAERTVSVDQSTDTPVIVYAESGIAADGSTVFTSTGNFNLRVTDDDGVEDVRYRFNGDSWNTISIGGSSPVTVQIPLAGLSDGLHEIEFEVIDTAGFPMGTLTAGPIEFRVDTIAPTAAIQSPASGAAFNSNFSLSGTADDINPITTVEYRINDGSWFEVDTLTFNSGTEWAWTVDEVDLIAASPAFGNNNVTIQVRATDIAGRTDTASRSFTYDISDPSLSISLPVDKNPADTDNITINRTIGLSGTSSDPYSGIESVELYVVRPDTNLHEITSVSGTTSWSADIDTTLYDNADYAVEVDPADGDYRGVWDLTLRAIAIDNAGNTASEDIVLRIDQTTNLPVISFTNMATDGSQLFGSATPIAISVTDDDGVDFIEYRFNGGGWNQIALGGNSTETISLSYSLPDGLHSIQVRAQDTIGGIESLTETDPIEFRLDTLPPSVSIATPASNSFWNDTVSVTGTATDANGITLLRARIDGFGDWVDAVLTEISPTEFSYTVELPVSGGAGLSEGVHNILVEATDGAEKTQQTTRSFTYDITPPVISILTPDNGVNVNGRVTLRGASTDDSGIDLTELRIGNNPTAEWVPFVNRFNWEHVFLNINAFANSTDAVETAPGSNVWQLPIYIRTFDPAGNETVVGGIGDGSQDYYLTVDPDGDNPEAVILQPTNNETVGGRIRVSGSAEDDDAVYRVEIAFDMNNDGTFSHPDDIWPEPDGGWPMGEEPVASDVIADANTTQWYLVNDNTTSGTWSNWSVDLNKYGEFNPDEGELRTIRIKVRAIDTKDGNSPGIAGTAEIITVIIDPNVPSIENLNYANGDTVGGQIVLSGTARDTSQIDFLRVRASGGGVANNIILINNGVIQQPDWVTEVDSGREFDFNVPLDSLAHFGSGQSGLWSFNIEADDGQFTSQSFFTLQVDNNPPGGVLDPFIEEISVAGEDYVRISNSAYVLQGTANDSGTVSGVEAVVVWLRRGDRVYDLRWNDYAYVSKSADGSGEYSADLISAAAASSGITYVIVELGDTDFTEIGAARNEVGVVFEATGSGSGTGLLAPENYFAVIDQFNEEGDDNVIGKGNQDGIRENLRLSAGGYEWYMIFDSTEIDDGAIEINYAVRDIGGNHTSYSEDAFVANKRPEIMSITLGTDLTGAGSVNVTESFVSAYTATDFTVRNELLQFTILTQDAADANTPLNFTVEYYDGVAWLELYTGTDATIDITDFSSIADTIGAGAWDPNDAQFRVTVTDSLEMQTSQEVRMNIDNVDNIPPSIEVAPFGQRFTISQTDGSKVLEAADNYNENIVTTGSGSNVVRHGYVQYAEHSSNARADISGKVIITGRAEDNQRIQAISVRIAEYDGGEGVGQPFTIATWDGTGLITNGDSIADVAAGTADWGFEVIGGSEFITEADGHVLNWRFAWNSARINGVARANVNIEFEAVDFGPDDGNVSNNSTDVDVVPYISGIINPAGQFGISEVVLRSATGIYSIDNRAGQIFRIDGFNLSSGNAYLTSAAIGIEPSVGDALNSTENGSALDIDRNLAGSGYLTVFVNGIASLNNLNNNDADYNQEEQFGNPRSVRWNDDRFLRVWDVTEVMSGTDTQTYYYPSMIMDGNQPLFSYTNDNNGYTYRTTGDNVSAWRSGQWYERHSAIARTDGVNWILSVQDAFAGGIGYLYLNRDRQQAALIGGNPRTNTNHFEILGLDFRSRQLNRVKFPKLHVDGPANNTNIYITYYDAHPDERNLSFVSFRASNATDSNLTEPANDAGRATQVQVIPGTANASSEYYDMVKVNGTDIAVIYFDGNAGALKLAYSSNAWNVNNLSGGGDWNTIVLDDSALTGSHVSAAVSQQGDDTYLYVAYHDAAETSLRFAAVDWSDKSTTSVQVDSQFSVGTRTNMHVIDGIPYISYSSDSYIGTRNSMRLAYPVAANERTNIENILYDGSDQNDQYTGNWEITAVPTYNIPRPGIEQFHRTMINQYVAAGENLPVVGWLSDKIEYARMLPVVD